MGVFQIIDSKIQWEDLLNNFKEVDVYYSYDYGNLFAKEEKGRLLAAYYEDKFSKVFYPFIKRNVEWYEEKIFDIVTPYGYGGPLIEGNNYSIEPFYRYFRNFCKENNIITETTRYHPINKNHLHCKEIMDIAYIRKTTAVDLTLPLDEIREHYSPMNKKNIKKAKKGGLYCYVAENTLHNIHTFIELYKETMDRNHAENYYYFNDHYFFEQIKNTKISKTYILFTEYCDEVIAGVMVLKGPKYSHYHLGSSKTPYLHLKPNNLLFDFMIEFCKSKGSELLHLGGGCQENDGLFQFKASFTNNNHYDYFIGKRVYDEKKYNKITEEVKRRFRVNEEYFPIYRGKKDILNNL
ncbi:hypothetical protein BACCIP111895_02065 [Neobacillus rhizosphaerae]|uniref:Lipid II:glycine glycyltransferase n=1 Tax=Neobacillus rhizosphaerae TaxID=2880965 RepID=A0ABN8KQY5_9BACI|nr:GNAT family N-acetyltransferase [Neobacillus rhizosphaerae]CAH2714889.1 hypothetical protein BACCIP111895_02065 [Neobacillus rhizosphaerae]